MPIVIKKKSTVLFCLPFLISQAQAENTTADQGKDVTVEYHNEAGKKIKEIKLSEIKDSPHEQKHLNTYKNLESYQTKYISVHLDYPSYSQLRAEVFIEESMVACRLHQYDPSKGSLVLLEMTSDDTHRIHCVFSQPDNQVKFSGKSSAPPS